jgi:hypothetical protein
VIEVRPAHAVLVASLLGLLWSGAPAAAAPREARASVAWVRAQRVYLTSADSSALAKGDRLTFVYRGKAVASGVVARVYDRDLAMATLSSGSLAKVKRLDRLRVLAEPAPLPDVRVMRIGFPARDRSSLIFACGPVTVREPFLGDRFRVEAAGENGYRLVRGATRVSGVLWPDTLLIRLYDEAADEEIALERGELDVAVFWPGELSTHAREDPRWQDSGSGIWGWTFVGATWDGPDASAIPDVARADSLDLAAFNQDMFRGDLMPWPGMTTRTFASSAILQPNMRSKWWPRPARFVVDPSFPGQRVLERFLDRDRASTSSDGARTVRLVHLDAPIGAPDTLGREGMQVSFLFALRCPIVCAAELRPFIAALGEDALVNLISCAPAGRRP